MSLHATAADIAIAGAQRIVCWYEAHVRVSKGGPQAPQMCVSSLGRMPGDGIIKI